MKPRARPPGEAPSTAGSLLKAGIALAAAVLIAALLASCGGDGSDATGAGSSSATTTESSTDGTTDSAAAGGSSASAYVVPKLRPDVKIGPLRVTAGGTEQFSDIGDYSTLNSDSHKNSSKKALAEAARVVHEYLIAHVKYDWEASCSYLNEWALGEVTILGSHFKEVAGEDCPTIISYLLGKVPAGKTYVASEVDAGVLRVRREGGYLFYRAGGKPYTTSVERDDDGNWKVGEILVSQISPPPS